MATRDVPDGARHAQEPERADATHDLAKRRDVALPHHPGGDEVRDETHRDDVRRALGEDAQRDRDQAAHGDAEMLEKGLARDARQRVMREKADTAIGVKVTSASSSARRPPTTLLGQLLERDDAPGACSRRVCL